MDVFAKKKFGNPTIIRGTYLLGGNNSIMNQSTKFELEINTVSTYMSIDEMLIVRLFIS